MKVAELKNGMLIKARGTNRLTVKFNGLVLGATRHFSAAVEETKYAIYLGQRDDIGGDHHPDVNWSNRFVLFKDRILAVDPSDWHKLEPAV